MVINIAQFICFIICRMLGSLKTGAKLIVFCFITQFAINYCCNFACEMDGITTVFFDIDDTLWHFSRNSELALASTFKLMGCDNWCPNYDAFHDNYEHFNHQLWQLYNQGKVEKEVLEVLRFEQALEASNYCCDDVDELAEAMNTCYLDQLVRNNHIMPGAIELLQYLHGKGYQINALSNGFKGAQERKLEAGGMNRYITHLVLSEHCGITKPRRGIFDYAMKLCGAEPHAIVMIGDDPSTDIAGAHNAGWRTIYINARDVQCREADHTVGTLLEIKDLL